MPNAVPLVRASETRTMSVTPAERSLLGIGIWPHSGMPGPPLGPLFRSTSTTASAIWLPTVNTGFSDVIRS